MRRTKRSWGAVALSVCAISACAAEPPDAPTGSTSDRWGHGKPSAPVDVRIDTQPLGGGEYAVTLTATPRRSVKALGLALDGRTVMVGPSLAGVPRTMTARIALGADGAREIVGSAVVDVGKHRRRAAASARLGIAAVAPPPYRIVRLPDGSEAAEVRP